MYFACMCIVCIFGVHGGQKRASDSLKLVIQFVVSCHVDDGSQSPVLCKSSW